MKKTISLFSLLAVLSATSAFATQRVYHCESTAEDYQNSVTFTVGSPQFVKIDDDIAQLDESYEPRLNQGYTRFEYQHSVEGLTEVLVQTRMIAGSRQGFIKIQNRGESFGTDKYACTLQK